MERRPKPWPNHDDQEETVSYDGPVRSDRWNDGTKIRSSVEARRLDGLNLAVLLPWLTKAKRSFHDPGRTRKMLIGVDERAKSYGLHVRQAVGSAKEIVRVGPANAQHQHRGWWAKSWSTIALPHNLPASDLMHPSLAWIRSVVEAPISALLLHRLALSLG